MDPSAEPVLYDRLGNAIHLNTPSGGTNYRALGWLMYKLYDAGLSERDIVHYAQSIGSDFKSTATPTNRKEIHHV